MRRRDGLAVVAGFWAFFGVWVCLFIWTLYAGMACLVALFLLLLYAALFVWPEKETKE